MIINETYLGGFDSSVHISEEAYVKVTPILVANLTSLSSTNAATAVPWAIIAAIGTSGILGTAMNIVLAFCAGTDMAAIIENPIGQPMATVRTLVTLGCWAED